MIKLSKTEEERASELSKKLILIDSLCPRGGPLVYSPEIVQRLKKALDVKTPGWALRKVVLETMVNSLEYDPKVRDAYVNSIRQSRVTAVSETVSTFGELPHRYESAIKGLSLTTHKFDVLTDHLIKATRAEDIRRAKSENKYAVLLNLQNAAVIGDDLRNLDLFYSFGVRIMQLTYNLRNLVGTGCTERNDSGLSEFGTKVVEKMNQLHMLVDLSHCGHQTSMDAIERSKEPVTFTHTGCKSVYDHPRSKTDEELKAIAEKDGYVGIYALTSFLKQPPQRATIEDVMDHVDYAVKLLGVNHVGIGTDYEQPYPNSILSMMVGEMEVDRLKVGFRPEHHIDHSLHTEGFEDWTMWPNIIRGLVSRGYSDEEISKIGGMNFLSILERVVH